MKSAISPPIALLSPELAGQVLGIERQGGKHRIVVFGCSFSGSPSLSSVGLGLLCVGVVTWIVDVVLRRFPLRDTTASKGLPCPWWPSVQTAVHYNVSVGFKDWRAPPYQF
jgi:hypothetical protein